MPFLDLLSDKNNHNIFTLVYRKSSFTGFGTNYFSYCDNLFKVNSIKLINLAYKLFSSYISFHNELIFMRNCFKNNSIFDFILNKFLINIYRLSTYSLYPKVKKYFRLISFVDLDPLNRLFHKELFHAEKILYSYTVNIKIVFTNKYSYRFIF